MSQSPSQTLDQPQTPQELFEQPQTQTQTQNQTPEEPHQQQEIKEEIEPPQTLEYEVPIESVKDEQESKELDEEGEEKLEEQQVPQADADVTAESPKPRRRARNPITEAQRSVAQQRLALLQGNFNPIPFSPKKTLDFSAHEELFRALNLWEFVNLDLTLEIRPDLLILLIANYNRFEGRSFVGNVEFSVGPSDLARALKLPVMVEEEEGPHRDLLLKDSSKEVIEEFLASYVLLENEDEDEDDMCILPEEVVTTSQLVKEGRADKVDWAGLIWVLVEKELLGALRLGTFHYASHLQCLMKFQQPGLFDKDVGVESLLVPEPESSREVSEEDDYDNMDGCGMKMRGLEEFQDEACEGQGVGLRLGMNGNGSFMEGIEDYKGNGEGDWVEDPKDDGFGHCLRRCSSNEVRGMEFENLCKGEQMETEDFSNLDRLTSTDLLHAMGAGAVSYSPRINHLDQNTGDFVSMGADANKNASVDTGSGGSHFFENNGKRHIEDVDEDAFGLFHQNNQQKRMRSGGAWGEQEPAAFNSYMEQIQCTMDKAKMLFAQKEEACLNARLQLQYMNEMLEQKDQIIHTLEKTRVEELQKWQQTLHQYEHELNIVANLVVAYKKALKETQNNFEDYRKKFPQGDEPLYRDVDGAGGLVVTSGELEKLQLEREEEMRQTAEEMINAFECEWQVKFEDIREKVMRLHRRLVELEGDVKFIKERLAECKGKDA